MRPVAALLRNVKGLFLMVIVMQILSCQKDPGEESNLYGTWTDPADGTVYRTLQIGDQLWMADNLNRGEMVDGMKEQVDNGIIEKYCYDNNPVLCEKYGGLYQWNEAMQYRKEESVQGICPEGWHIPSDSEWKILEIFLGMSREEADDNLWRGVEQGIMIQPGGDTGFESLRGGNRFSNGNFYQIGSTGYFWTSTRVDEGHAWRRGVNINEKGIYRSVNHISYGFSVRCVRY